ncbi:Uncharacterised protein [uncultured archaeon]|nr:Uncharacterised protein [uncultured archaeon]
MNRVSFMRFTTLDSKHKSAPSFSARQSRYAFVILASAEVLLLALLLVLFIQLRPLFDPALLLSVMLVVLGIFTYAFTRSISLAQSVMFICLLLLEFLLFSSLPVYEFSFLTFQFTLADLMPAIFVGADALLLYWILTRGLGIASQEETASGPEETPGEIPDAGFLERTQR